MTVNEIKIRQSWTLEQKIDHSVGVVEAFVNHLNEIGKEAYISFSGGKDSTVMVDLIRRFIDPERKIKVVFCNTGNEYPEIIRFVRSVPDIEEIRPNTSVKKIIEKYGFPLISKEQAHSIYQAKTTKSEYLRKVRLYGKDPKNGLKKGKISDCWHFLVDEPFLISEKCCKYLKVRPMELYKKKTGKVPIIGVMADESQMRQNNYVKRGGCNSFEVDKEMSCPMSIWTDKDIWAYINYFKIPYCSIYDIPGVKRTGCRICGFGAHLEVTEYSRFHLLYDRYPKAYKIFMDYQNNGITYREALRKVRVCLPDENRQLKLFNV